MKLVNSLYFKVGVAMICVMATGGIISGYGISFQIKGQLEEQLVERANFTVHSLERAIAPLIDNRNFTQLQKLVETIGAYRFIRQIFLMNREGRVLASNDPLVIGEKKDVSIVNEVFKKNLLIRTVNTENDVSTAYPVMTEAYDSGAESDITHVLYVVLDTDYQHQILLTLQKAMTLQTLGIYAIIAIIGIALIHFIIIRPLNDLVRSMDSIAKDEYLEAVEVKRKDELGVFMHHFNHMATMISNRTTELSSSRERLDLALKASDAGLWDWNIKTEEVIFNERWATMLGYQLEEIDNNVSSWEKLLHPDEIKGVIASLESHIKGETPMYQNEYRMLCKDNSWIWILDTGRVVQRDSSGNPERVIGTHIDINRQKMTEADLEKHRNNLEQLVKERTRELENTQKELINKAVEAGRAQLSAMMLHNIGNAITPVSINTEKLKSRNSKKVSKYLLECYNELAVHKDNLSYYITSDPRGIKVVEFMRNLIQSLEEDHHKTDEVINTISTGVNYVSRILSLQRSYYAPEKNEMKENVNLNELVEDALRIHESSIDKRSIMVEKNFLSDIPPFPIEKNKLMQVLVNLVKNSCDAIDEQYQTDSGQQNLICVTTFVDSDKVGFSISDSGCGVEKEKQNTIFDFGISSKGSSGFGLYYCKNFVEANNGKLTLESEGKGKGAKVTLEMLV